MITKASHTTQHQPRAVFTPKSTLLFVAVWGKRIFFSAMIELQNFMNGE